MNKNIFILFLIVIFSIFNCSFETSQNLKVYTTNGSGGRQIDDEDKVVSNFWIRFAECKTNPNGSLTTTIIETSSLGNKLTGVYSPSDNLAGDFKYFDIERADIIVYSIASGGTYPKKNGYWYGRNSAHTNASGLNTSKEPDRNKINLSLFSLTDPTFGYDEWDGSQFTENYTSFSYFLISNQILSKEFLYNEGKYYHYNENTEWNDEFTPSETNVEYKLVQEIKTNSGKDKLDIPTTPNSDPGNGYYTPYNAIEFSEINNTLRITAEFIVEIENTLTSVDSIGIYVDGYSCPTFSGDVPFIYKFNLPTLTIEKL